MSFKGFSVNWSGSPNMIGTNPPNPKFVYEPVPSNMEVFIRPVDPTQSDRRMPIGLIQSRRTPYAQQNAVTKYGESSMGLGTMLGT